MHLAPLVVVVVPPNPCPNLNRAREVNEGCEDLRDNACEGFRNSAKGASQGRRGLWQKGLCREGCNSASKQKGGRLLLTTDIGWKGGSVP